MKATPGESRTRAAVSPGQTGKGPKPFVSILIPTFNEERFIAHCLDSVIANDYPPDRIEILVIDGGSRDRTRDIIQTYAAKHQNLRLLDNPRRVQSVALNIGLRHARGEIAVRMDAHAKYAFDYVSRCVELLGTTEAVNVGGLQRAIGFNYVSDAIALVSATSFGAGDAFYRYAREDMWVDTVYLGAWRTATLVRVGGFDESMHIQEDYELNIRLRENGGKILLSPSIRCEYFVRSSLLKLARQYFRYGFWKIRTLVLHPDSLRWRQLASPVLILALLASGLLLLINWRIALLLPALYLIVNLSFSLAIILRKPLKFLFIIPFIFAVIHISWGLGFYCGFLKWGIPRFTLQTLKHAFSTPYRD